MLVDVRAVPQRVVFNRRPLRILVLGCCSILLLLNVPGLFSQDWRVFVLALSAVVLTTWMLVTMRCFYKMVADQRGIRACRPLLKEFRVPWSEVRAISIVTKNNAWGAPLSVVAVDRVDGRRVLLTQVAEFGPPQAAGQLQTLVAAMDFVRREATNPR